MRLTSSNRAFSLVELLVVVTIIALLAAVLFPVFAQAKRRAVQTNCISHLRQTGVAIGLYQAENGDLLPVGKINTSSLYGSRDAMAALEGLTGGGKVLRCPLFGNHTYSARWIVQTGSPQESRLMIPHPTNVLARCIHHLDEGWSGSLNWERIYAPEGQRGNHVVLLADLSVKTLDARTVRPMIMVKQGSEEKWEIMSRFKGSSGRTDGRGVYASEQWPPRWLKLPENYGPNHYE